VDKKIVELNLKSKLYSEGYKKERKKRKNKIVTVSKEKFNISFGKTENYSISKALKKN
jgi:hypothetical protein